VNTSSTRKSLECPRWAVLLAGGDGRRVRNVQRGLPKCLIEVGPSVTVLDVVVAQLLEFGVKGLWVAARQHTSLLCQKLAEQWPGVQARPLSEPKQGTWNVLGENRDQFDEDILLANGDTVYLTHPCLGNRAGVSPTNATARIGVGISWGTPLGNVLVHEGLVFAYDKGGTRSNVSDSGFHVINVRKNSDLLGRCKGMLEDGFIQELVVSPQPLWHLPVSYLDLGTETALKAAHDALVPYTDTLASTPHTARRAAAGLWALREHLSPTRDSAGLSTH
jgi:hypothetical protein